MNWIQRNLGLKIVSLFIALVFWDYVESQAAIRGQLDVAFPVLPENLSDDFTSTVVGTPIATISGPADVIKEIKDRLGQNPDPWKLYFVVDLSRAAPGKNSYTATYSEPPPYKDENVTWPRPVVTIDVEPKVSSRPVKIELEPLLLPPGLTLDRGDTTVEPPTAIARGTEEQIRKLDHIRASIDFENHYDPNKTIEYVPLSGRDATGGALNLEIEPRTVDVHPVLEQTNGEKRVLVSPMIKGSPAPGYQVTGVESKPNELMITGDPSDVKSIDILNTTVIDISGIKEDRRVRAQVITPDTVMIDTGKPANPAKKATIYVTIHVAKFYQPKTPVVPTNPNAQVNSTSAPPIHPPK